MQHNLIIGFFDTDAASRGTLVVNRALSEAEVRKLESCLKQEQGQHVELMSFFDRKRGVLEVPWLHGEEDIEKFADMVAAAAHRILGAAVADVHHGEVLFPPK